MFAKALSRWVLCLALSATTAGAALAAPLTFNFRFVDAGTGATAVGFITFESTLLANPGANSFILPNPAVLDLQVTVSGAASGNGAFGIGSFGQVIFDTNGGTLDFGRQLIGQPTATVPWASTPGVPGSGDFNLFGTVGSAPLGTAWFTLSANAGASTSMVLASMTSAANVPTLDPWAMAALAVLLAAGAVVHLRRRPA